MEFGPDERTQTLQLIEKIETLRIQGDPVRIMSFEDLCDRCTIEEMRIIDKVRSFASLSLGEDIGDILPSNLIHIEKQSYTINTSLYFIWNVFLSPEVFRAFSQLNHAVFEEMGDNLIVASGYRSCAYQVIVFLKNLIANNWDVAHTLSVVSLPGQSEHNNPVNHAIDVFLSHVETDGKGSTSVLEEFGHSRAFNWMQQHGKSLGFTLSFPEHNTMGMIYEPWHWLYTGVPVVYPRRESNESQIPVSL